MAAHSINEGETGLQFGKALLWRERQHPAHEAEVVLVGVGRVRWHWLWGHVWIIGRWVSGT